MSDNPVGGRIARTRSRRRVQSLRTLWRSTTFRTLGVAALATALTASTTATALPSPSTQSSSSPSSEATLSESPGTTETKTFTTQKKTTEAQPPTTATNAPELQESSAPTVSVTPKAVPSPTGTTSSSPSATTESSSKTSNTATATTSAKASESPISSASESATPSASHSASLDKLLANRAAGTCADTQYNSQVVANFEIDGNLCSNSVDDWTSVVSGPSAKDGITDSTQFTNGASETNWPWTSNQTNGLNTAGDKNDINNVYATQRTVGTNVYAFLGFDRASANGTTQLVVELNALPNVSPTSPIPIRSTGDLRLLVTQGGNGELTLSQADVWTSTGYQAGSWSTLSDSGSRIGTSNNGGITNFDGSATLGKGLFAELAVNLTALFGEKDCSGNYGTLNIRSSASGDTSSLKDWVAPIKLSVPSTCSSVVVDKKWVIDGKEYTHGQQPEGFNVDLELTGQSSPKFGTEYNSTSANVRYKSGDSITVDESGLEIPEGCVNVISGDQGTHKLTVGKNAYTLTNTLTCTQLTLIKKVVGDADPTSWTLDAAGPTPINGSTRSTTITKANVKAGTYTLSESGGPTGYQLTSIDCGADHVVSESNQITLATGDKVVCTLTNTAKVTLTVTKKWVVNGVDYPNGDQPVGKAQLLVDEAEQEFGATLTGYLVGDEVKIAESVTDLPDLCEATTTIDGSKQDTITHTMTTTPDPNLVEVVNTVDCVQELTLIKEVDNTDFAGTSRVSDWTLTAQKTDDESIKAQGITGEAAVTAAHVPTGSYSLSESGPKGYEAGAWTCSGTGEFVDGSLALDLGEKATCTIVNTAKAGSVQWNKTDARGRLLAGATWELTGPAGENSQTVEITDCTNDPCDGPDRDAAGGKFSIENLAWGDYTLTETLAPPGYQRDTKTHEFTVQGEQLQVELAAIVNEQQEGPALPLTGGIGRDHVYLLGGSILVLGLLALGGRFWKLRHNRKAG